MNIYTEKTFSLPELVGISAKSVAEHLKLYSGYVKNANLILEKIKEYEADGDKHSYAISELQRRFSFEFNGMRNHEYYFQSLEGGSAPLVAETTLRQEIEKEWGSFDAWLTRFKNIASTRGVGWAILYYDPISKRLTTAWIDEQHLGQLNGLHYIVGIDMWEHSYYMDYGTDKKKYIDAFFANLNWTIAEQNLLTAMKK